MLILVADAFDAALPGKLKKFGEVTDDASRLAEADVVLVRSKTKCTKDYIDKAVKVKLIIRGGVGLDNIDLPHAKSKGIKVMNTASASSIAVAELAFALMIAVPNRLVESHNSMKDGKWLKKEIKRTELMGKTLGLIGAGNIGTELAKRAAAFGMKVIAFDPLVKTHGIATLVGSLDEIWGQADYISLHVPLVDSTRNMIDGNAIEKMKKGVVIVNTARGGCIVEKDLAAALAAGKVAAYATDVYTSDPPPADSPILSATNVIMTPHTGASSKENLLRIGDVILDILGKEKL